ncbi:unnamed protein product [Closterium sp. NIES-53]
MWFRKGQCADAWWAQARQGGWGGGEAGRGRAGVVHMWVRESMDKFESQHAHVEDEMVGQLEAAVGQQGSGAAAAGGERGGPLGLISRARISMRDDRWLMGIVDETGLLQVSERAAAGDLRLLTAVDVPCLHHLIDCLVLPKNGPRPHANEASGSDMDGDVYFVTWDPRLLPPGGESSEHMDYQPDKKEGDAAVTMQVGGKGGMP